MQALVLFSYIVISIWWPSLYRIVIRNPDEYRPEFNYDFSVAPIVAPS